MSVPPSTQKNGPPDFLHDGTIMTLSGWCNLLIVAPNLSSSTEQGSCIDRLAVRLVHNIGACGVINYQKHRRPVEGDPTPEELQIPDAGPKDKRYKEITALRERLIEETSGIPVDLNSYASAFLAAYDYLESIWLSACEIAWKAVPLVLFIQDMDDLTADALDLDVAVCRQTKWEF